MAVDKLVDSTQLDSDLSSVANAIRAKSGGSGQLAFPAGFVSEIGNISSGGGQTVYTSSTGLLYTPTMTIDVSMENPNTGLVFATALNRFGTMSELVDLTLTGKMRIAGSDLICNTDKIFPVSKFPKLKKLTIVPTEIRASNGSAIDPSDSTYNVMKFGHYVFSESNLQELTLGKVGGPYWVGAGYYRKATESGASAYSIGSTDGLTLKVYVAEYKANGGFGNGSVLSTTTIIEYNYTTGEVITA